MPVSMTKPRIVAFEVTRRCRFSCVHCRSEASRVRDGEDLTTAQCIRIMHKLAAYCKSVVVLTGGEPMEREDIYDLMEAGQAVGHRMALASSGYPITDDTARKLKDCGLLTLSFSLDGIDAHTHDAFRGTRGAYRAVLSAIGSAQKQGLLYQINTAVTRQNLEQVMQIAELAQDLGAYCFNPFILVPTGRGSDIKTEMISPQSYEELLVALAEMRLTGTFDVRVSCGPQFQRILNQQGKQQGPGKRQPTGCSAGKQFAFINYRGGVQPCGFLNLPVGNLLENDFKDIWEHSSILNRIRDRSQYTGMCVQCEFRESCGGCRARAMALTNDYLASDPICLHAGAFGEKETVLCVDTSNRDGQMC
ncbi:radical SAM protein [Planctomycetota bacterium]